MTPLGRRGVESHNAGKRTLTQLHAHTSRISAPCTDPSGWVRPDPGRKDVVAPPAGSIASRSERTRPYVGSTAMPERAGCAQSSTSSSIASHEVRRCLRRRLTVLQNAELVTFRICQHHPRNIALPNVNTGRSQCDESLHLGGLIVRTKIDMEAILALLGFVDWQEQDPGSRSGCG